jgi:hypothetical protein
MDDEPGELTPRRRQHWAVEPEPDDEGPAPVATTRLDDRFEAKRLLWRDSATILVGVVVALLVVQLWLRFGPAVTSSTPAPGQSETILGPGASNGSSDTPGSTLGPIVDPSLGTDVRPTRRPSVTLPPTGTQPPGPPATPRPTRTQPPTLPPTPGATPTPTPVVTPAPTPIITPPPPPPTEPPPPQPHAAVSCDAPVGQTVTCTSASTDIEIGSEIWSMGGPGVLVSGGDGSTSITWTYTDPPPATFTVTLTVTGVDGTSTDSASTQVAI